MKISIRMIVIGAALGAAAMAGSAQAGINFADVAKNLQFTQTDNIGTTAPIGPANAFFYARTFYNSGDFDGGSVTFDATTLGFNGGAHDCCGSTGGQFQTGYLTKADMDATYPTSTTYTMTVTDSTAHNANASISVDLPDDIYAAVNPIFDGATFDALNTLTAGQGLTIGTNTFDVVAGATGGQNFLTIFDLTGGGVIYSAFGANTRNSWAVDPGLFLAGHSYQAELIFDSLVNGFVGDTQVTGRDDLRTDLFFSVPSAAGVPEPAAWALMLVGFGAMGASLRRRRQAALA